MADLDAMAKSLQDPAYVAVGLGILGFQRAQVYRVALQRRLGHLGGMAQGAVLELGREVAERTAPTRQTVADVAGEAVAHLPEPARDLVEAVGRLVVELPHEAKALSQEVVALGRFAMHAAGAPASRYASKQGT